MFALCLQLIINLQKKALRPSGAGAGRGRGVGSRRQQTAFAANNGNDAAEEGCRESEDNEQKR